MPLIFIIWLIYLWIKKGDKHKDIVLYSVYASILGFIVTFVTGFLFSNSTETSFNNIIFMFAVAIMMLYFQETRKTGIILLILGLIGSLIVILSDLHLSIDIFGSAGVAIITTVIIYYLKEKLAPLNLIFKLIYLILK